MFNNATSKVLLLNSLIAFICGFYIYYYNGISVIIKADPTYITFGIIVLYFLTIPFLLYFARGIDTNGFSDFPKNKIWFIAELMLGLGLLGTIIGMVMVFGGLQNIDVNNIKALVMNMSIGIGVSLYTTIAGLIFGLLLKIQMVFIFHDQ